MVSGKTRIKFVKTGRMKFISHLDLLRTFKSVLGRAGVPVKYSEGFNPHPKMVFSLPLPVGAESVCEYLDIVLTEERAEEQLIADINRQLTEELKVVEIYPVDMSFQQISCVEYDFTFDELTGKELEGALSGALEIEKHSKKGMVTVDLRPKIAEYQIKEEDTLRFHALLGAESGDFVNPELLVRAIEKAVGKPITYYSILRLQLYTENGAVFH